ncbi:MAG: NfeD family protein [Desulforhopalus sp.]
MVFFIVLAFSLWELPSARPATDDSPLAVVLEIDGSINPAVSDYFDNGLEKAIAGQANLLILKMNTPGGLDRSMRDIIQHILSSPIPVVSYVFPEGARAASAGTYILYASHVAAMSPATNIGAATPVSIGGLPGTKEPQKEKKGQQESTTDNESTMKRKVINDASAYIRSLAERQGRNGEWAELAVREAVSLSAKEALDMGVIDFVASDLQDLLSQLDGHEIRLNSKLYRISTEKMTVIELTPTWRYKLLSVISDPNVAYFLLLLGFYGLVYELANPGVYLPGVAGGISLLLAFYAFQILPINYSGLALIILGLGLLISETFVPSFGALGIGGIVSFVVGSLILIDDENLRISLFVIAITTIIAAVFVLLLLGKAFTFRSKKVITGDDALVGMTAEAVDDIDGDGWVELLGELWKAHSADKIRKGQKVTITSRDGLVLTVKNLIPENKRETR